MSHFRSRFQKFYNVSYAWYGLYGFVACLVLGLLVSLLLQGLNKGNILLVVLFHMMEYLIVVIQCVSQKGLNEGNVTATTKV